MTVTSELLDALRNEIRAEMRAQKTELNSATSRRIASIKVQVADVAEDVAKVRGEVHTNHVEGLQGFSALGDELAKLRGLLEPVFEHHARRARRRARNRRVLTSVPAMLTLAATIAGTAGALVALF